MRFEKNRQKREKLLTEKKTESCIQILILILATFSFAYLISDKTAIVSAETITQTVCCEKLHNGAWCQNEDSSKCNQAYKQSPTSCDATSFCKNGCCYDSNEGTCAENTPQNVCNANNGTWADSASCEIPQCNLGCCVLDTQAAFVSLTRCKKLSGFYGLETDFRPSINNELECIATTQTLDRGACVYDVDYISECKFTTRGNCKAESVEINGTMTGNFTFYKDYLCSAEELGTKCGPTKNTICVPGKDEVYFVDTCGNPANIYDAGKVTDKSYWKKIIPKTESCGYGNTNGNAGSSSCGNCDYFSGSFCRVSSFGNKPSNGNYICADLSCANTYDGNDYRNGESWCVDDKDKNSVGARYFKHVCANGEEILEPCADFRQEACLQDSISTGSGAFSQAACIANMWQDCTKQTEKLDCENIDKRDCVWKESSVGLNVAQPTVAGTTASTEQSEPQEVSGVCVPKNAPGLKHYEEGEAASICSQANTQCVVTFEKGLLAKEGKCTENCECLDVSWEQERNDICSSLGDCGGKKNFVGTAGYKAGYNITKTEIDLSELFLPLAKLASFVLFGDVGVVRGLRSPGDPTFGVDENGLYRVTESNTPLASQHAADNIVRDIQSGPGAETVASKLTLNPNFAGVQANRAINIGGKIIPGSSISNVGSYQEVFSGTNGELYVNSGSGMELATPEQVTQLQTQNPELFASGGTTPSTATGIQGFLGNAIIGTLAYGLLVGGVAALIASFIAPKNSNGAAAAFAAGLAGGIATNIAHISMTGTNFLGGTAYWGIGTNPVAVSTSFNPTTAFWGSAGIGIAVFAIVFIMMYKETNQQLITFQCNPWEAPTGGNDCQKCNQDPFKPCSDYRCRSLGQSCKLLNAGAAEENCAWVNRNDVKSPGISPWTGALLDGYSYTDTRIRPPGDGSEPGKMRIVKDGSKDGCIPAFTPISFGVDTIGPDNVAEPAQCKLDYVHTTKFDDMKYYFGGSNAFLYNHTQVMSLPGPSNVNSENPTIQNDGEYSLYVRCKDSAGNIDSGKGGNENVDEFVIRFCVDKGPDVTSPVIEATSIINGMPINYNINDTPLEVYINEPAKCRWDRLDRSYGSMETPMTCSNSIGEINNNLLYRCSTTLTGIQNRKENLYYFRCNDTAGNENADSYEFKLIGTEPLNILKASPDNETIKGFESFVPINLEVDTGNGYHQGDAICYYSNRTNEKDYVEFFETGTNLHKQTLRLIGGNYNYYIKCVDLGGNTAYDNITFKVEVDQAAPEVVRVYNYPGSTSLCGNTGCLAIVTDEKSTCSYSSQDCNFDVEQGTEMPFADSKEHYAEWKTSITYYVRCKDSAGNEPLSNRCSMIVKGYELG